MIDLPTYGHVGRTAHQFERDTLRRAIHSGAFAGGQRLVQADIAAQLDVSELVEIYDIRKAGAARSEGGGTDHRATALSAVSELQQRWTKGRIPARGPPSTGKSTLVSSRRTYMRPLPSSASGRVFAWIFLAVSIAYLAPQVTQLSGAMPWDLDN